MQIKVSILKAWMFTYYFLFTLRSTSAKSHLCFIHGIKGRANLTCEAKVMCVPEGGLNVTEIIFYPSYPLSNWLILSSSQANEINALCINVPMIHYYVHHSLPDFNPCLF